VTVAELRTAVLSALRQVVPDVDTTTLRANVNVREQVDMDSIDFLRFLVVISKTLGVDVPETDYARLATVDSTVTYLAGRLGIAS
jgi:acyl carrier protein